jgi:hypothetical protein
MRHLILWILLLFAIPLLSQENKRSIIGHSHNDYEQAKPLYNALEYAFESIEVDVFYHNDLLIVSHNTLSLDQKPTIQELYLDPIDSLVNLKEYQDRWNLDPLTLMIDLKTNDYATLQALQELLSAYDHLLQKRTQEGIRPGPVRILISGEPPVKAWMDVDSPYFYLDGRLGTKYPEKMKSQILRISAPLRRIISNQNLTNHRSKAYAKFKYLIKSLYALGYEEVRFWATPDTPKAWQALIDAGVNVISVDDLQEFRSHF